MRVVVIGGGISGRIVQLFFNRAVVLEARDEIKESQLTRNFGTNYLWEPLEGFKCRKLDVVTHVDGSEPTEASIKRYKNKIGKGYENREDYMEQFHPHSTGWEIEEYPPCKIQYNMEVKEVDILRKVITCIDMKTAVEVHWNYDFLFSTAPLPVLVKLCGLQNKYPTNTMFKYKPIYIKIEDVPSRNPDMIYVNYVSDPTVSEYRFCIRNGKKHIESLSPMTPEDKKIYPGKIYEDPHVEKLLSDLKENDIIPIGRFGKWASDELVHSTYNEVKRLHKEMTCKS